MNKMSQRQIFSLAALSLFVALLALYWPIMHADFAWDELLGSLTSISARSTDKWHPLLIGQTNGFATYFRPLVMALFSLEMWVFASQPGPMHAVSLAIHALNVVLVGMLAMRLSELSSGRLSWRVAVLPMLIYAVHPLLIEPVSWIGCQYDLAMTTFTLVALLANITFKKSWVRAITVSLCFFLAACCKESAVSFPLVLLACDWMLIDNAAGEGSKTRMRALIKSNGAVYIGVLLAGVVYLAFRHHYLGHLIEATEGRPLGLFGRFQEVSFLLVHYLRMLVWPMTGLNPIHPVAVDQFRTLDMLSLATDIAAAGFVIAAVLLALRRQPFGVLVLVAIFSLLPVLHIVPIKFDASLYHERYAMTALALACCILPLVIAQMAPVARGRPLLKMAAYGTLFFWLVASLANVRATVPLWSSDMMRWQWAYVEYPASDQAQESLLNAYIDNQAYASARKMVDQVLARESPCLICIVHAAEEALATHQPALADMLLDRLDLSGLRQDREVAERHLEIRKQISTDQGDSIALGMSFGIPLEADFTGRKSSRRNVQLGSEPRIETAATADPLLAFVRPMDLDHRAQNAAFARSFPEVFGANGAAL